ncbi:hypothetical protein ANN_05111 [Periplaneta americana]|uniref:Uncharacterized protein n=1 Tax=Periplaneta americana TaxID=6978 RepID=A0ABQ8TA60_PERAM|nr:hypothetical protein ANN_05111 [Periplaneta americana]
MCICEELCRVLGLRNCLNCIRKGGTPSSNWHQDIINYLEETLPQRWIGLAKDNRTRTVATKEPRSHIDREISSLGICEIQ